MELENSFVVPADIDTAWKTLLDVEAIAPCMPGATLTSFDGDNFTADVKVKLGPVTMTYAGKGSFVSKDEAEHKAIIEGVGKESRGTGTAKALVTTQLFAETPDRTRVEVVTDLAVTGKAAQFGRGVMADVSKRLVDQFSKNLEQVIMARKTASLAPDQAEMLAADAVAADGGVPTEAPRPAPAPSPVMHEDVLDIGNAAMVPVLKRAIPLVVGVVVVGGLIWWLARRSRSA
jgi:carbon monoxide dehydrogenase subunit G